MLKGVLPLLLLRLVADTEDYGYSVVLRLHDLGLGELNEGTVYPALSRLETRGLLGSRRGPSSSGPARKRGGQPAAGAEERARAGGAWKTHADAVRAVLSRTSARNE